MLSSETVGLLRSAPSAIIWLSESAKPSRSDFACATALIRAWFCCVIVAMRAILGSREAFDRSVTSCLMSRPEPKPRLLAIELTMVRFLRSA